MASGETLCVFTPADNTGMATGNRPTLDLRNGHLVLDFDDSSQEHAVFPGVLPRSYDGGGLTVRVYWSATSATTGNASWLASIERLEDEGTDTDADSFDTINAGTSAAPSTSGALQYTDIALSVSLTDDLAVGEAFRLKISRNIGGLDTMAGDAEIHRVEVRET